MPRACRQAPRTLSEPPPGQKKGFAREHRRSRSGLFLRDQDPEPGHPESDGGDEAGQGAPQNHHVPAPGAVMRVSGEGHRLPAGVGMSISGR